jgi:hypothetical protein
MATSARVPRIRVGGSLYLGGEAQAGGAAPGNQYALAKIAVWLGIRHLIPFQSIPAQARGKGPLFRNARSYNSFHEMVCGPTNNEHERIRISSATLK